MGMLWWRAAVAGLLMAALASQARAEPAAGPVVGPVVRLRADQPHAILEQQTGADWRDVCVAPCGTPLDPKALYRVGGGGFRDSQPFLLPRPTGDVLVDARMGRASSTGWAFRSPSVAASTWSPAACSSRWRPDAPASSPAARSSRTRRPSRSPASPTWCWAPPFWRSASRYTGATPASTSDDVR